MPTVNRVRICNKQGHGFFDSIIYPNGCPKCRKESNKIYDTTLRATDRKKIYNSAKWKQVRELALLRDEFLDSEEEYRDSLPSDVDRDAYDLLKDNLRERL